MHKLYPKEFFVKTVPKTNPNNPIEYLRAFFNFGYYFYYLPYRFELLANGNYAARTTKFRQVCCGVIHTFTLLRFMTAIREVDLVKSDPSSYFEFVRNTATFIYTFAFVYCFWTKKSNFVDIFSQLQQLGKLELDYSKKIKTRTLAFILCTTYAIISILNFVLGHGIVGIQDLNPRNFWNNHAGHTLYFFFLRRNFSAPRTEDLTPPVSLLTAAHLVIQFYFKFGAHYTELSVLLCALTMRSIAKGFSNSIRNTNGIQVSSVLEQYETLKKISKKINLAIGPVTLCCIFEAMPYYATHIGDILSATDWFVKFRYLFFIVNFFSIVIIAADITHHADALRKWFTLDENHSKISYSKLLMVINELSTHPIGFSAKGLFTITYGLIGTILSIVLTYAVIILQFKSSVGAYYICTNITQDYSEK